MLHKNKTAGHGQHSHDVPSEPWNVVVMRDGSHSGTEVYKTDDGKFHFVSLDRRTVQTAERCVLVQLTGVDAADGSLQEPYAMDLDSPDGLALIGCDENDRVPGTVLWDSQDEQS